MNARAPKSQVKVLFACDCLSAESDNLVQSLSRLDYRVEVRRCPELQNLNKLESALHKADLLLIDLSSPNYGVFDFVRNAVDIPTVFLADDARDEIRVASYQSGVDDYILKSCSSAEVELRLRAILKRCLGPFFSAKHINSDSEQCVRVDNISLDKLHKTVTVEGEDVPLTPLEFKLLWLLVFYQGRTLSKPYTYLSVLGREYGAFDRSIDMHLSRIRKKLSQVGFAHGRIKTIRGQGYSFS